jgi:hypothetical protein
MNIEISANEYRDLLDIVHIAEVILSGHRKEPDKRSERHRALIQKLYSFAKSAGLDRLTQHDAQGNVYAPTLEFEQSTLAHVLVDEFGDHIFWDELISRLSVRDAAISAGGMEHLNALNENDRQAAEGPIRQGYIEEFSKNGIYNLVIIDRFDMGRSEPVKTSD